MYLKASLLYINSFSFLCGAVFWTLGIHESWLVLFIWTPPLVVLVYLVSRYGFVVSCFDSFAILNLAYVYMLFDYVSTSLGSILLLSFSFPPVSPPFFLSLFLGSLFCSFGPLIARQNVASKVKAAFVYGVKYGSSKTIFVRVLLILYTLLSVVILRAVPEVVQLPLTQLFSFGFLIYALPCLPRKLNTIYLVAFSIDYLCMLALVNPNTLAFGNRTSALQPLFIIVFLYAMNLFSSASSLVSGRATYVMLDQSIHQARSEKSQQRKQDDLVIPKWFLYACIAAMAAAFLLASSTITKFSSIQDFSLSDSINYYFDAEKGYIDLELRARIANLVYASQNIIDMQFFQLFQLISSFIPSAWFAWKPEYDITPLLFESSIYPQPLYFEPFLNQFADLGVAGPLFYAFFIYVLHSLYVKTINVGSRISVFCWKAAQPLVLFSIIFFMQTPWHFARGSLFVMVMIAMFSFVSRLTVLSPRNT
jgi:hypothetical protein